METRQNWKKVLATNGPRVQAAMDVMRQAAANGGKKLELAEEHAKALGVSKHTLLKKTFYLKGTPVTSRPAGGSYVEADPVDIFLARMAQFDEGIADAKARAEALTEQKALYVQRIKNTLDCL